MDPAALAFVFGLTLAGVALSSRRAKHERAERDAQSDAQFRAAAREHARLLEWRRGWAIAGDKGRVGFTADARHVVATGATSVWRIDVAPAAAAADISFSLREGNFIGDGRAGLLLSNPGVVKALTELIDRHRVRALDLSGGVLAVRFDEVPQDLKALERYRSLTESLALAVDRAATRERQEDHAIGSLSGVPVAVR